MVPNSRERKALKRLRHLRWEDDASLCVGEKTITSLLERGWAERVENPTGRKRLRITETGIAALDAPIPPKAAKKTPLKMLKPGVPTLSPRLKTKK